MIRKNNRQRTKNEEIFHDDWAASVDVEDIDVVAQAEVCTAPEMRKIIAGLGDIKGKKLLDIGCGLGEASIYFALKGARVTATDISSGMLEVTQLLAKRNGVSLRTHLSEAENLKLEGELFDVIYVGNLFHHVEIESTISRIKPLLAEQGVLVSWDPIAYNPLINIYRRIATEVRTPDEHPLTVQDTKTFKRHFDEVDLTMYWLTTLTIFVLMAITNNPNKVRFWKRILDDGEKWGWLYVPLEKFDRILLWLVPPLRWLCWNVVVFARKPKNKG